MYQASMTLCVMFYGSSGVIHQFILKGLKEEPHKGLMTAAMVLYSAFALLVVLSLLCSVSSSNLVTPLSLLVGLVFGYIFGELQDVRKKAEG